MAALSGPVGDVSYRDGRTGSAVDPYLVRGAEKFDAGPGFPGFYRFLDELRVSTAARYPAAFTPPRFEFEPDATTVALYHFDEGTGTVAVDATGGNPGTIQSGGSDVLSALGGTRTPNLLIRRSVLGRLGLSG